MKRIIPVLVVLFTMFASMAVADTFLAAEAAWVGATLSKQAQEVSEEIAIDVIVETEDGWEGYEHLKERHETIVNGQGYDPASDEGVVAAKLNGAKFKIDEAWDEIYAGSLDGTYGDIDYEDGEEEQLNLNFGAAISFYNAAKTHYDEARDEFINSQESTEVVLTLLEEILTLIQANEPECCCCCE